MAIWRAFVLCALSSHELSVHRVCSVPGHIVQNVAAHVLAKVKSFSVFYLPLSLLRRIVCPKSRPHVDFADRNLRRTRPMCVCMRVDAGEKDDVHFVCLIAHGLDMNGINSKCVRLCAVPTAATGRNYMYI